MICKIEKTFLDIFAVIKYFDSMESERNSSVSIVADPDILSRRVCIEKEGKMFRLSVFGRDLPSRVTQKLGLSKLKNGSFARQQGSHSQFFSTKFSNGAFFV